MSILMGREVPGFFKGTPLFLNAICRRITDLGPIKNERIFERQSDRGEVEGMRKALIKSGEMKHLNP